MEQFEARILIKNLLNRVETLENGVRQLSGSLTPAELAALKFAVSMLDGTPPRTHGSSAFLQSEIDQDLQAVGARELETEKQDSASLGAVQLDLSALAQPSSPSNVRVCLDFGTAMSKATLVEENIVGVDPDDAVENIIVLELGVPGEQEEISETMLISSVYIDNDGLLWFGKAAVDQSNSEAHQGTRRRIDNIKQSLSEGALDEIVTSDYNPTQTSVTYGEMVLAYLMYFTWAVNDRLKAEGYAPYLPRRYAIPCLGEAEGAEAKQQMAKFIGEAQVLADTFRKTMKSGIGLTEFLKTVKELRKNGHAYEFVSEPVTEPLGVANSLLSWRKAANFVVMIIDVGAGTSDFSLFSISVDPDKGINGSVEVKGSARGITEAGNHLDKILMALLLNKAELTPGSNDYVGVRSALELRIRDYKETLFNENAVTVILRNGVVVEVGRKEFLELDAVREFGDSLRNTMQEILDGIRPSWARRIQANPMRRLVVATTGGGNTLPMVRELANGSIIVHGTEIPLASAVDFPEWLKSVDLNLEADYPRIAVSLGGARKNLISSTGTAAITADVTKPPRLQGYYQKGA